VCDIVIICICTIWLFRLLMLCACDEQFLQIDRINNIYKVHNFSVCGSGFGFEIKEVSMYSSISSVSE